jgi:hypothetical protein
MADYDYEDEELDDTKENLIKDLRKQLKALSKEKSELSQELSSYKTQAREKSVSQILEAKGVSPKVAKFLPSDLEGEEAISTWLDENADIFGYSVETTGTTANVDDSEKQAANRLRSISESASTPNKVDDIETRLKNAKTEDEINAIWEESRKYFL